MFSSYCTFHPASDKTLIDIRDACARPGTVCAIFDVSGMPSMSRLHLCVDLSFDLSGILIVIGFLAHCTLFTGVPGRKKCPVAPASTVASLLVILVIDVEYDISVF